MKRILKKTGRIAVVAATLLIMLFACSTGVKAERPHPINIVEGGENHYSVSPYDLPSDHKIKLVINGAGSAGTAIALHLLKLGVKNIIAVDLNSTDETKQILEKLSNEYENIKVANWKECKDIIDNINNVTTKN